MSPSTFRIPSTLPLAAFWLVAVLPLAGSAQAADTEEVEPALVVLVRALDSDDGNVHIALFDSAESFTRTALHSSIQPIDGGEAEWRVEGLEPGDYALALFHDENGNGELDKKLFGLPREPYAFSNGARARFGPPKWEKAKFTYAGGDEAIEVPFD